MMAAANDRAAFGSKLTVSRLERRNPLRSFFFICSLRSLKPRFTRGWRQAAVTLAVLFMVQWPGSLFAGKLGSGPGTPPQSAETLLSGNGWKLGSFPLGEGESRGAFKPTYDDSAFRIVQVPGEVQLQTGLKGNDLFLQSKSLSLINNQEW